MMIEVFLICIAVMSLPVSGEMSLQRRDARQQSVLHMFRVSSSSHTLSVGRNKLLELSESYIRGSPHDIPNVEEEQGDVQGGQ
jgi:hypothetical protein